MEKSKPMYCKVKFIQAAHIFDHKQPLKVLQVTLLFLFKMISARRVRNEILRNNILEKGSRIHKNCTVQGIKTNLIQ